MGWIGVDFDGTLATYYGWDHPDNGAPIPAMVDRVKRWLTEGKEVRILTARVSTRHSFRARVANTDMIHEWCRQHLGKALDVTAEKDNYMEELWDDRAIGVERNTGRTLTDAVLLRFFPDFSKDLSGTESQPPSAAD